MKLLVNCFLIILLFSQYCFSKTTELSSTESTKRVDLIGSVLETLRTQLSNGNFEKFQNRIFTSFNNGKFNSEVLKTFTIIYLVSSKSNQEELAHEIGNALTNYDSRLIPYINKVNSYYEEQGKFLNVNCDYRECFSTITDTTWTYASRGAEIGAVVGGAIGGQIPEGALGGAVVGGSIGVARGLVDCAHCSNVVPGKVENSSRNDIRPGKVEEPNRNIDYQNPINIGPGRDENSQSNNNYPFNRDPYLDQDNQKTIKMREQKEPTYKENYREFASENQKNDTANFHESAPSIQLNQFESQRVPF
jgi:hypothetical protein